MNLQEVADYLKVSVTTVYRMAQQGRIPGIKVGRQWRFRQEDIYNLFVQQYYQKMKKPTDATLRSSTLRSTRKK
jgi:excisionase family DNA binding protein